MLTIEKVKEIKDRFYDGDFDCSIDGATVMELLGALETALLVVEAAKTVIRRLDGNGSYDDLGFDRLEDALKPFSPQPTKP